MAMCYPDSTDWGCALTADEVAALDPALKARSEMLAWTTLQRLTGYRLALCPTSVRPCAARCNPGAWMEAPVSGFPADGPYISQGVWYNACGCSSPDSCSCGPLSEVILPASEVGGVSVRINGATLDPSAYRVDNGNRLVRTDGGVWPMCQDMSIPEGPTYKPVVLNYPNATATFTREGDLVTVVVHEFGNAHQNLNGQNAPWNPATTAATFSNGFGSNMTVNTNGTLGGTIYNGSPDLVFAYQAVPSGAPSQVGVFEVTYYPGLMPDDALNLAAGMLAVEWYKACTGKDCRLPAGATRVQRQGISFEVPADMFASGLSGIREVDAIVASYNPYRLTTPSAIFNPDARKTGRVRTA